MEALIFVYVCVDSSTTDPSIHVHGGTDPLVINKPLRLSLVTELCGKNLMIVDSRSSIGEFSLLEAAVHWWPSSEEELVEGEACGENAHWTLKEVRTPHNAIPIAAAV